MLWIDNLTILYNSKLLEKMAMKDRKEHHQVLPLIALVVKIKLIESGYLNTLIHQYLYIGIAHDASHSWNGQKRCYHSLNKISPLHLPCPSKSSQTNDLQYENRTNPIHRIFVTKGWIRRENRKQTLVPCNNSLSQPRKGNWRHLT